MDFQSVFWMRIEDLATYGSVLGVVLALCLWAPGAGPSRAGDPPQEAPAAVRNSGSHISSVPVYQLFPPSVLRKLADRAHRASWKLPDDPSWPQRPDGAPVVETERVDELTHTVGPGQSLDDLQDDYRCSLTELRRWNPRADLEPLESGQELVVWRRTPGRIPSSYGGSDWGRLYYGEPMPDDENWELLFHHRTFGTHYTVSETVRVLEAYAREYPDSPRLMVGDISFRGGGRMHPHASHQTGRDVDISYPREGAPRNYRSFHHVRLDELDVEKTLFLVRKLLENGYVRYIFIDHRFQRKLYELAERKGAPDRWLDRVFSYPEWGPTGIVRHEPGHKNHMHIRFRCQSTDRNCS